MTSAIEEGDLVLASQGHFLLLYNNCGDIEHTHPTIYDKYPYLDLYLLVLQKFWKDILLKYTLQRILVVIVAVGQLYIVIMLLIYPKNLMETLQRELKKVKNMRFPNPHWNLLKIKSII